MKLILLIIALLLAAVAFPFLTIAAVNTLFGTAIPYTLATWASAVWIAVQFGGSRLKEVSEAFKS